MIYEYDLIIVGGGIARLVTAFTAALAAYFWFTRNWRFGIDEGFGEATWNLELQKPLQVHKGMPKED
jgi:hypothetical protein